MESVRDGRVPASAWPSPDDAAAGLTLDRAFGSASPAFPDVVRERLNSVLDADVIPRLLLAHSHDAASQPAANPLVPPVDDFVALVVHGDAALAADAVLRLRAAGVSVDRLLLDLLAPTARRLGEMWTSDRLDFVDVTIGLTRLQSILHGLTGAGRPAPVLSDARKSILLAPGPGEQHTFGITIVCSLFEEAGWRVAMVRGPASEVVRAVRREPFTLVGFSLSSESRIEALASAIRKVRRASRNRAVGILVGGRVFADKPETAVLIGADATAPDGPTGVMMAQSLLDLRARAC